jgi:hypothetical protein
MITPFLKGNQDKSDIHLGMHGSVCLAYGWALWLMYLEPETRRVPSSPTKSTHLPTQNHFRKVKVHPPQNDDHGNDLENEHTPKGHCGEGKAGNKHKEKKSYWPPRKLVGGQHN